MFQSDKVVNSFALIGGLTTGVAAVLGLLVYTGHVRVSVSRTKKVVEEEKVEQKPVEQVEMAAVPNPPTN